MRATLAKLVLPCVLVGGLAALPTGAAAAAPPPRPQAHAALAPLAVSALSFIGSNLAAGVISKVGGDGFGAVLSQAGFPDQATQTLNQLKAVGVKLDRIEASVDALHTQVNGLSSSLADSRLSAVRHSAAELVGRVDRAMQLLAELANGAYTDPLLREQKREELITLIRDKIKDEQSFLNQVIYSGQGNDDIIRQGSMATRLKAGRFWGDVEGRKAAEITSFYLTVNAEITLLRVEYEWSSVQQDSTETYITQKRAAVKRIIDHQNEQRGRQVEHEPRLLGGYNEVIDTKTRVLWDAPRLGIYDRNQVGEFASHSFHRLPTLAEFRALVAGRPHGQNPREYLRTNNFQLPTHCDRDPQDYLQHSYPATETVFWTQTFRGSSREAWASHDDGNGLLSRACLMENRPLHDFERYYY